jgi:hypothetical protein
MVFIFILVHVILEKLTVTKLLKKFHDFWNPKFHYLLLRFRHIPTSIE